MNPLYSRLRELARRLAACYPTPDFYQEHAALCRRSRWLLYAEPILIRIRAHVAAHIEDDFGHGLQHADKVAIDAGALILIEHRFDDLAAADVERRVVVVQAAGLLHDIKRKQPNHAAKAADYSRRLLTASPLGTDEVEDICTAIANHEAFQSPAAVNTAEGALVADCLYDADKFRWGPDNFTDTLWAMVTYANPTLEEFVRRYPHGMAGLSKIKKTFRTPTGRRYGPQIIDIGIAIGRDLFHMILTDFADQLP
jgi:hypothetical protein